MPNLIGTEARRSHKWSKNQIYTILGVFHFFKKICWQNRLIWQKTDFENLKNRQTAKMAVFGRFWVVFGRFLADFWFFCNFYTPNLLIGKIWITKFLKSAKPPIWRFLAVFVRFWVVLAFLLLFGWFLHTKRLLCANNGIFEIWKSTKPPIWHFCAVFVRVLCSFCAVFIIF